MQKAIVRFAAWLLKKDLSLENKSILVKAILKNLHALPLHEIIKYENGSLQVNGKDLSIEEIGLLKNSARALRDNRLYGLIQDQVLFEAMTIGVNSTNFEQGYFSKAAVWWGRRENELTKLLLDEPAPLG